MKKTIEDWEFQRFKAIQNMDSLDRPIRGTDGTEIPLGETLGNNDKARAIRIRAWLISMCNTKIQEKIITLFCEGYDYKEIAEELGIKYQSVKDAMRKLRERCLELENVHKKLKQM